MNVPTWGSVVGGAGRYRGGAKRNASPLDPPESGFPQVGHKLPALPRSCPQPRHTFLDGYHQAGSGSATDFADNVGGSGGRSYPRPLHFAGS